LTSYGTHPSGMVTAAMSEKRGPPPPPPEAVLEVGDVDTAEELTAPKQTTGAGRRRNPSKERARRKRRRQQKQQQQREARAKAQKAEEEEANVDVADAAESLLTAAPSTVTNGGTPVTAASSNPPGELGEQLVIPACPAVRGSDSLIPKTPPAAGGEEEGSEKCPSATSTAAGEAEDGESGMPADELEALDGLFNAAYSGDLDAARTVVALRGQAPDLDLEPWLAQCSLSFRRYVRHGVGTPPPLMRLAHRRGSAVSSVDLSLMEPEVQTPRGHHYGKEEDDAESDVVLGRRGEWLAVSCPKGVYFFNEKTGESTWYAEGTPFAGMDEDDIIAEASKNQPRGKKKRVRTNKPAEDMTEAAKEKKRKRKRDQRKRKRQREKDEKEERRQTHWDRADRIREGDTALVLRSTGEWTPCIIEEVHQDYFVVVYEVDGQVCSKEVPLEWASQMLRTLPQTEPLEERDETDNESDASIEDMERALHVTAAPDVPEEMLATLNELFASVRSDEIGARDELIRLRAQHPHLNLEPWLRECSISFRRFVNGEDVPGDAPGAMRLIRRRQFRLKALKPQHLVTEIETPRGHHYGNDDTREEEGEDSADRDEVLRRCGDWFEVACPSGIYYFNERTGQSTWHKDQTPFLLEDGDVMPDDVTVEGGNMSITGLDEEEEEEYLQELRAGDSDMGELYNREVLSPDVGSPGSWQSARLL